MNTNKIILAVFFGLCYNTVLANMQIQTIYAQPDDIIGVTCIYEDTAPDNAFSCNWDKYNFEIEEQKRLEIEEKN